MFKLAIEFFWNKVTFCVYKRSYLVKLSLLNRLFRPERTWFSDIKIGFVYLESKKITFKIYLWYKFEFVVIYIYSTKWSLPYETKMIARWLLSVSLIFLITLVRTQIRHLNLVQFQEFYLINLSHLIYKMPLQFWSIHNHSFSLSRIWLPLSKIWGFSFKLRVSILMSFLAITPNPLPGQDVIVLIWIIIRHVLKLVILQALNFLRLWALLMSYSE